MAQQTIIADVYVCPNCQCKPHEYMLEGDGIDRTREPHIIRFLCPNCGLSARSDEYKKIGAIELDI
jgi:rubredoxin